ncbi:acyl-CoA dehydrogenase family protein [Nocardia cyriacigeorgica]|uniref:acyl-CoA dehydrogenase family protein n=1 Tax=Nocardia cyriacigeorgica TaxID=135487 RepID=UPI0013D7A6E9|nr:acyl-CoA dehydrogenase family protein [Nocardia cyriacigeorgica]MBF6435003.1 acyl-CoA dehydrogenase family protein [Nocardia cyriacigeorgica]MBF6454917.1 acyl-CoA dehydrogenase family protein [Nocardia cyriacigeorgica]MBF6480888.1 acyl-CoA dehydrogenase family protein [Nocardia cyriacigeorgica]MBF6552812.1 acyl-CoA dehydrogenase family protein [Nocardia cyriacigeorgica]NEW28977.1 acyl-CoA dehydrogenase [Nocardia cyriacigeorgica]
MARAMWSDDEVEAVRDLARNFFEREVVPHEEKFVEQGHPDRELYRTAGKLGLLCAALPEAFGGGGGTFAHEAAIIEEQVRAGDGAMGMPVHSAIIAPYLAEFGSDDLKQRVLPRAASGDMVLSIGMTEPGTGSDLQNIKTRAVRDGDDYVITGSKIFITNGWLCDGIIIAAKTDPEQGAAGVSLLFAEVGEDTPGFTRGRILSKIGGKGQDTAELFFDGLRVPAANLLGGVEGQGFYQMMQMLAQERLVTAIMAVAMMERAVELTVEYTKGRAAFGKPLFAMQNTKFELAECATLATVSRTFLDDCITKHLRGELDIPTAAMSKYWLTDQLGIVVDRCLQLFGGYGYMTEYPISQLYTGARVLRILAGSNEVMKDLIARSL